MTTPSNAAKPQRKIVLGRPVFDQKEPQAVAEIFQTSWVLNGPKVREFEKKFAEKFNVPFAQSVSSCTAGMHLSLAACDFEPGSEVLLPAFNFVAAGLAVLTPGLKPVFVDVNPATGNMDVRDLARRVTSKSRAILALHYAGRPCDMENTLKVARENNLKVVEDASHALGASYQGKPVGTLGDATCFSFGPLKMICTGMGGMVTTNDEKLSTRIAADRSYGMDKSMWNRRDADRPWSYSVQHLGHNFRMTDYQAAMGVVQLEKLDGFVAVRRNLSARYDRELVKTGAFTLLENEKGAEAAPLYYAVKVSDPALRDKLAMHLVGRGIGASVHWDPPLHAHPLYGKLGYREGDFPATEALSRTIVSLPLHPAMSEDDVDYVIDNVRHFFNAGA